MTYDEMTLDEYQFLLNIGADAWNYWRKKEDIATVNLSNINLKGLNLRGANFRSIIFDGANLQGTLFDDADLRFARFVNADLSYAQFQRANLTGALLIGANLKTAYLVEANLTGAKLAGANFDNAKVGVTYFCNVDLSQTNGLETVRFSYPCYLDIHTLFWSHGQAPASFLRGCGATDTFIEHVKSMTEISPIEYSTCFISYSSVDASFAERLHADLQNNGIRCWFAPEDMKIGEEIRPTIDKSIRAYDKLLIILSENSIASTWVKKEVETAFEEEREQKRIILCPIRLDNAVMETDEAWAADIRRTRNIGNFSQIDEPTSYQIELKRLIDSLQKAT